jgi:hypothetical protein
MKIASSHSKPQTRATTRHGNGNGNGHGNGNGPTSTPAPHYDSGARFDSGIHYADPAVPVDEGAKAKLDLGTRNDDNLLQFAQDHIADMTGNASFPTPAPTAVAFQAVLDTYASALTAANNAKSAAKQATSIKNAARAELESALGVRRNYVQIASNGNEAVILSSGLAVQAPRTPKGQLPPPLGLSVDLNGTVGVMKATWVADPRSVGYLLRWSKDTPERTWSQVRCSKALFTFTGMEVGQSYVFQVAAAGGVNGQSYWTPEVFRTAA